MNLGTRLVRLAAAGLLALPAYGALAYVVLPLSWRGYARFASAEAGAGCSRTAEGIPADPLNVSLVGTRRDVMAAMGAAGWAQADPITWRTGLRDAASVLFDRPYPSAPVSTHYLLGRRQDLAFERIEGRSPRRRHHVRLWQTGEALWIGAATFDRSLGVSRRTGELMHHIEPDVDAERTVLFGDLGRGGHLVRITVSDGPRPAGEGRNGGGDRYTTDGEMWTGILRRELRGTASVSVADAGPIPKGKDSPESQSGSRSR